MKSKGKQMHPKLFLFHPIVVKYRGTQTNKNENSINDFFINIVINLTKHLKKNNTPRLKIKTYSMFLYKTNWSEIQKIIQGLDK